MLAGADFSRFRPWIVLLEATRPLTTTTSVDWEPALLAADYQFVWFDGLNRFYLAREHHEALRSHFELPPNSFDDFVKYDFERQTWLAEREAAEQRQREMERHLQGRLNEVRLLDQEVRLRRASQSQAAAELTKLRSGLERTQREQGDTQRELEQARQAAERLRQDLAAIEQKLQQAEDAARQEHRNWEVLTRLACELRWEDGPRALRLVLPLARLARKFIVGKPGAVTPAAADPEPIAQPPADAPEPVFPMIGPEPPITAPAPSAPRLRHAVHQFHPGSSYGDAITNAMLLTQRILRGLGYRSEIYVEHRDALLADRLLLLDDLPLHDDYVLIVRHSLGHRQAERLAALPAPKILLYHNITPARFLRSIPALAELADLGRSQLDFWRPRVAAALSDSPFNALELYQHGFEGVAVCPLLFDVEALQARARPGFGRYESTPFTVLFVGRVVESKAPMDLVDAFDAFRRLYARPCRLVLVGRFEGGGERYVQDVFERIGVHGLRQMVELTGQVSDDELAAWYDRADLFVSLSQHEGFGVPLIEAMAHDLPVLAYATGAVPFTMNPHDHDPRTILASREPQAVAEAILALADDPALRSEIVEDQRRNLQRFRLSLHVPTLVQALACAGARPMVDPVLKAEMMESLRFTVTGHVNGSYSLASVNRSLALALDAANPGRVRVEPVEGEPTADLSGVPSAEMAQMRRLVATPAPVSPPLVVISQHYPVYFPAPDRQTASLTAAYFFWEESAVPAETIALLNRLFGAVFAPTGFVAKVLLNSGLRIPVRIVGYVPRLDGFTRLGDQARHRGGDAFVFLHVSSAFPRKGVDVLLKAYADAFTASDAVRLVIKTFPNPHNQTTAQIEQLREVHGNLPEIVVIERELDEDELLALYGEADAVVLPTRGEGFNIPAAEAMAAAVPLIVTGAGGHTDFITDQDAMLIPWRVQQSRSHLNDGGSLWFEPDDAALAAAMREMFDDLTAGEGRAASRAATAREVLLRRLDPAVWARRVAAAAADVLLAPKPRPMRLAWVSSWDVRCGVAEYTRHYVSEFELLAGPDDKFFMLCDDRAMSGTQGRLQVLPAWCCPGQDIDRLAGAISREDADVVMIQHQPGLIGWNHLAALLRDARLRPRVVVVTLHATRHLLDLPAADRAAVLEALAQVARVVVHTVTDVNLLHQAGLFKNVIMISQGVPPMVMLPPEARPIAEADAPVIGCFGFLLPPKGLRHLITALALLRARWPNLRLRMVNALHEAPQSRDELMACQELAERLEVASSIDWITDFLPHQQSIALLRGCDLIVLPYLQTQESSSAALRSCLSSGTPVAVTPIPIFDEADDAVFRFDAADPAAIAQGIASLLTDVQARQSLQDAAVRWTEERAWNKIARQVHGMVTGLVVNSMMDQQRDEPSFQPAQIEDRRASAPSRAQKPEYAA